MQQIMLAFITGLTTGGLSCLAVQGGLLASSLAHKVEQDLLQGRGMAKRRQPGPQPDTALPILLFLLSKLAAYTLLGLLLGLLGSALTLTPGMRAFLLIAIGIFMIGNALRMLDVHPFFRYFTFEPPKFVTRYIRRTARTSASQSRLDAFTPLFLGALTVLIPCGVTQAMMAVALASGDPLQGAALMFAFTLGASPVFFLAAYLTTQIGKRLEKWFVRFVALVVLALGLVSVDSGLALAGSPLALSNAVRAAAADPGSAPGSSASEGTLLLNAYNGGYEPRRLYAPAGESLTLNVVTEATYSCARAFVIPALNVEILLPETGVVPIDIPPQKTGTVMWFTCSMGMYTGQIIFE